MPVKISQAELDAATTWVITCVRRHGKPRISWENGKWVIRDGRGVLCAYSDEIAWLVGLAYGNGRFVQ